MTVTTALYRRYRPDSFADVIGQEHVTEPLMTALRKNRVNHAYLFSGPRGCGKTTSARILARCLNCAKGPTDTPCGTCPSCIELARGGAGSLDVIEIDAASHGGVDDARDLRERATYAPVRDRYKIFIIDEAHMVTSAGFNALLKIVEEPPEHIKFIFATTEPDKVIGTIRSRTHHYPFRLVPPEPLLAYLELLCKQENVPVAPGVLSLVIRAGGGSVRDSLSVLDQLMAGAGPGGLDYELAVALLGYTHASLLDDVVEAIAASDAATVFRAVDRVIQTGHDPRRFVEDLLERFRDLIIVQAMPESAHSILRGMPADQIARMQNQAHNLGAAELSRAADVTNTALTEMTGATSPRLHLELLCARILLPSTEQAERGIAARIDRVERRLNYAGNDVGAPALSVPQAAEAAQPSESAGANAAAVALSPGRITDEHQAAAPSAAPAPVPAPVVTSARAATPAAAAPAANPTPAPARAAPTPARETLTAPRVTTTDWPAEDHAAAGRAARPAETSKAPAPAPTTAGPAGSASDVEVLRRAWPDVLQTLTKIKRSTWALVEPNAQVAQFDGQVLTLAFTTSGLAGAFGRADHSENLRQAIHKTIGIDCQIEAVAGGTKSSASSEPNPKAPTSRDAPVQSTDADWGLQTGQTPPPPAAAVSPAAASAPTPEPASREAAPGPGEPGTDSAGSYSYSDSNDEWAPRDEDAPPVEEEPPMDWVPSSPPVPSTQAQPQSIPSPAAAATAARSAAAPPAAAASPATRPETPSPASADAPDDPWARAKEQAPGVWTIGAESNVGSYANAPAASSSSTEDQQAEQPSSITEKFIPEYEPAAAQIPQPVGAMAASSGSALSAPVIHVAPSPTAAAARQSLYQRLSNSPEAEAGRSKAPARKPEAATAYVHDIPSADDETIEESGVFGRAAVERILGGKLVEERSLDGSPLPPRF